MPARKSAQQLNGVTVEALFGDAGKPLIFNDVMRRISALAETTTQSGLARYFGVTQSSITQAVTKQRIPVRWVGVLLSKNINPKWLLYGDAAKKYLVPSDTKPAEVTDEAEV